MSDSYGQRGLIVVGTVENIEHNSGSMPSGIAGVPDRPWATAHVELSGERVKFPIRQDGTMPVGLPNEGDEVSVSVSVGLKQRPGDMLHPYVLTLTATSCRLLRTATEVEADREKRSLTSLPAAQRVAAHAAPAPAPAGKAS